MPHFLNYEHWKDRQERQERERGFDGDWRFTALKYFSVLRAWLSEWHCVPKLELLYAANKKDKVFIIIISYLIFAFKSIIHLSVVYNLFVEFVELLGLLSILSGRIYFLFFIKFPHESHYKIGNFTQLSKGKSSQHSNFNNFLVSEHPLNINKLLEILLLVGWVWTFSC